eukprot:g825.t1
MSKISDDALDELLALASMFEKDEFEVIGDALNAFLESGDKEFVPLHTSLSCKFRVLVEGTVLLKLSVSLPIGYPAEKKANCYANCDNLTSLQCQELNEKLDKAAEEEQKNGNCAIFNLVEMAREIVSSFSKSNLSPSCIPNRDLVDDTEGFRSITISRVFFWSHHTRVKQRKVYKWSEELRVTGLCRIGKPGWIFCEAAEDEMKEFVKRIKHERWKQILLKWEEVETKKVKCSLKDSKKELDGLRLFPDGMHEIIDAQEFCLRLREKGMLHALEAGTGLSMTEEDGK